MQTPPRVRSGDVCRSFGRNCVGDRRLMSFWDPRPEVCGEHKAKEPCAEQDAVDNTEIIYGQLGSGKLNIQPAGNRLEAHRAE